MSKKAQWYSISFLALAILFATVIAFLKFTDLISYRYTSDSFTYDQMMQEILRGHFGLEYTYGNQFGDHALLWTILLAPVKLILGRHMIVFLVLLGPLSYLVSAALLFLTLRARVGAARSFWLSTAYLSGFMMIQGLHESLYGCHFDTLSGFLGTMFVCCLLMCESAGDKARRLLMWFWVLFVLFLCLKEEMALLGIVFFLVVSVMRFKRLHIAGLVVAIAFCAGGMLLVHFSATPWNRTNAALLSNFLAAHPLQMLRARQVAPLAGIVLMLSLVFLLLCIPRRSRNPYAMGLFAMGLTKVAAGVVAMDLGPASWHHFSGIVMLVGGLVIQLGDTGREPEVSGSERPARFPRLLFRVTTPALLAASFACLCLTQIPAAGKILRSQFEARRDYGLLADQKERLQSLAQIKAAIDRRRVVAIYAYTAIDWTDGYRFSFFPRGVFMEPRGIADYIVEDKHISGKHLALYFQYVGLTEFEVVAQTPYHVLYRRKGIEPDASKNRDRFVSILGEQSVGGAQRYPQVGRYPEIKPSS